MSASMVYAGLYFPYGCLLCSRVTLVKNPTEVLGFAETIEFTSFEYCRASTGRLKLLLCLQGFYICPPRADMVIMYIVELFLYSHKYCYVQDITCRYFGKDSPRPQSLCSYLGIFV